MKKSTIEKKLGHFRSFQNEDGSTIYQSRANLNRIIEVVEQDSGCLAFPCYVDADGNIQVAFHATTVKSLVEFLEQK